MREKIVIAEIKQRNMGERMSLEEEERLMKIVVENNEKNNKITKIYGGIANNITKGKNRGRSKKS